MAGSALQAHRVMTGYLRDESTAHKKDASPKEGANVFM